MDIIEIVERNPTDYNIIMLTLEERSSIVTPTLFFYFLKKYKDEFESDFPDHEFLAYYNIYIEIVYHYIREYFEISDEIIYNLVILDLTDILGQGWSDDAIFSAIIRYDQSKQLGAILNYTFLLIRDDRTLDLNDFQNHIRYNGYMYIPYIKNPSLIDLELFEQIMNCFDNFEMLTEKDIHEFIMNAQMEHIEYLNLILRRKYKTLWELRQFTDKMYYLNEIDLEVAFRSQDIISNYADQLLTPTSIKHIIAKTPSYFY